MAAEGFAGEGIHISLDTVEPEPTIAVDGAWGHPVAVTNDHLKIADQPLPLAAVLDVIRDVLACRPPAQPRVGRCFGVPDPDRTAPLRDGDVSSWGRHQPAPGDLAWK